MHLVNENVKQTAYFVSVREKPSYTDVDQKYLHCSKHPCTWRCSHAEEILGSRSPARSLACALRCCAEVSSRPRPLRCCPAVGHIDTSPHCQSFPWTEEQIIEPSLFIHSLIFNCTVSFLNAHFVQKYLNLHIYHTLPSCCKNMRCLSSNWAGSWLSNPPDAHAEPTVLFGRMSLSTINS